VEVEDAEDFDPEIARAVGEELRRARDVVGWTRSELVARLSFDIHIKTLAGYERGAIQCTVKRFVEICQTLGVAAPDVLSWAMQRAKVDLQTIGLQVDLRAVVNDKQAKLLPLRRWARKRLGDDPGGSGIARLEWPVVQEMAMLLGFDRSELVSYLTTFTPRPVPQRR
jgi:transcriptional regulator with XRE-family HTH domain